MAFNKITNEDLKKRWSKEDITKEEIEKLLTEFVDAVSEGTYADKGWPKWGYGISKLGIDVYHPTVLARNPEVKKKNIQVNVCCPGYVKTDMTSQKGELSIEDGIKTPVFLIEQPFEVKEEWQGRFFYKCEPTSIFG